MTLEDSLLSLIGVPYQFMMSCSRKGLYLHITLVSTQKASFRTVFGNKMDIKLDLDPTQQDFIFL